MSDLDNQLAVKVFGFTVGKTPKDYYGNFGGEDILLPIDIERRYKDGFTFPPKGHIPYDYFVPKWSTMHLWLELVNKINSLGIDVVLLCSHTSYTGDRFGVELRRWVIREGIEGDPFTGRVRETFVCVSSDTLPNAVCEAVLRSGLKLPY